jgi:hypothetical protein
MAVADLSKWNSANGRKQILTHVHRNYDKHFAPWNVLAKKKDRDNALESLKSLRDCRAWAKAGEEQLGYWNDQTPGIDFNADHPRPGDCDDAVIAAMKNMFDQPDPVADPSVYSKLPTFPFSGAKYLKGWISPWWLYVALVQPKAERNKELEAELPTDSEGNALTDAGLGGINDGLLNDDDRTGNVDDGAGCDAEVLDLTQTPCHLGDDEVFDAQDEDIETDDLEEAQQAAQEPPVVEETAAPPPPPPPPPPAAAAVADAGAAVCEGNAEATPAAVHVGAGGTAPSGKRSMRSNPTKTKRYDASTYNLGSDLHQE